MLLESSFRPRRKTRNARTAKPIPMTVAAIAISDFAPEERSVEGGGEQAEPDGQVVSLDEVELVGPDEGVEEEKAEEERMVEIEYEEVKAREADSELNDAEEEEEEEDATSANSCCGDGASKVSRLGTEQSKLPEP